MIKLKKGDKVRVVRISNICTNHYHYKIGDILIIDKVEPYCGNSHSMVFNIDHYIKFKRKNSCGNNRDLELIYKSWKQRYKRLK